jgi:hypothetical protein
MEVAMNGACHCCQYRCSFKVTQLLRSHPSFVTHCPRTHRTCCMHCCCCCNQGQSLIRHCNAHQSPTEKPTWLSNTLPS